MNNDIISGIARALFEKFGKGYKIYTDEKKQGFEEPCFFILPIALEYKRVVGNRYKRNADFAIHYFSKKNTTEDKMACLEQLFECLEYIRVGEGLELCRGTEMRHESSDGVLLFFVSYNGFVYKTVERIDMEELDCIVAGKES